MVQANTAADRAVGNDILSQLVTKRTQMTISELMPLLDIVDLVHFYQLNKSCKRILTPGNPICLRFNVLFAKRTGLITNEALIDSNWQQSL